MKNLILFSLAAAFFCNVSVFAENSANLFSWSLLASGSWEDSKTLHHRLDLKLNFLPLDLSFTGRVLDRRSMKFGNDSLWNDFLSSFDRDKGVTNFLGALYHNPTKSRLLYGVIDEEGLSARIRNPWIRSPPYPENRKPLLADLKTEASVTKEDELYLYLSSPKLEFSVNFGFKAYASAQAKINGFAQGKLSGALSAGLDFAFSNRISLQFEYFLTGAQLPATKNNSWFSLPPPLPERKFVLNAASLFFDSPFLSLNSDFALSETFAWGIGFYANFGIAFSPLLQPQSRISRPLTISFAADGAGERFVNRDGGGNIEGFRLAAKIEWKGSYSALYRTGTELRAPSIGGDFSRSSTEIYCRFPDRRQTDFPVRLRRISFDADRNADNPDKIKDTFSGSLVFSVYIGKNIDNSPLGVNISGSVSSLASWSGDMASEKKPSPYPVPDVMWKFNDASVSAELSWSPSIFQFRSKLEYSNNAKNEEKWGFSIYSAAVFKFGRLSLKAETPNFGDKWIWTVSWQLQKK